MTNLLCIFFTETPRQSTLTGANQRDVALDAPEARDPRRKAVSPHPVTLPGCIITAGGWAESYDKRKIPVKYPASNVKIVSETFPLNA